MQPVAFFSLAVLVIVVLVNGLGVYVWARLNALIHQTAADTDSLVGDHVARIYTQYLYNQMMAGKFSATPRMVAIGNPERDRVVRAVKGSDEYERLKSLASYIKGLPINFVGFVM